MSLATRYGASVDCETTFSHAAVVQHGSVRQKRSNLVGRHAVHQPVVVTTYNHSPPCTRCVSFQKMIKVDQQLFGAAVCFQPGGHRNIAAMKQQVRRRQRFESLVHPVRV